MSIERTVPLAVCLWLALTSWILFCLSLGTTDPDRRDVWRACMRAHLTVLVLVGIWAAVWEGLP